MCIYMCACIYTYVYRNEYMAFIYMCGNEYMGKCMCMSIHVHRDGFVYVYMYEYGCSCVCIQHVFMHTFSNTYVYNA